ncbi:MAG: lipoyl(octanoyl) transferase LipB [Bdellovibrionales bacterium]|nr:lipoyl(octanoyl) transferase LipB [Bdellovibrionales bacterium]
MTSSPRYLGRLPFRQALIEQERVRLVAAQGTSSGCVLGFESEPVVTLGVRAGPQDLLQSDLAARGFALERVDRGGQATLHNPGQLVIFPVLKVRPLGAKDWVCLLVKATQVLASDLGQPLRWDPARPGLYSEQGKVVALGVRLRGGISTHGLAINIHNDLRPFSWIRACGHEGAALDHLPTKYSLPEVFARWIQAFDAEVDKASNLAQFKELAADVRL